MNILFTFRIFEQLALALKNRGSPEFTVLNVDFLLFRIFEQLALALKNRVALEFFTVLKYISLFRIFEQLVVALKTEFALKFFKPGGAAALPDPPPRTPMLGNLSSLTLQQELIMAIQKGCSELTCILSLRGHSRSAASLRLITQPTLCECNRSGLVSLKFPFAHSGCHNRCSVRLATQ